MSILLVAELWVITGIIALETVMASFLLHCRSNNSSIVLNYLISLIIIPVCLVIGILWGAYEVFIRRGK